MKNQNVIGILFLLTMTVSPVMAGTEIPNGGDLCEKRIKEIRDDMDAWIQKGGSAYLKLPEGISLEEYNSTMQAQFSETALNITCGEGPVYLDPLNKRHPKTCKNFVDTAGVKQIECDLDLFMNKTSESDQYVLMHHEFAGLAGFEVNSDASSDYTISAQLTGFLENQVVKRLAIAPVNLTASDQKIYCPSNPAIDQAIRKAIRAKAVSETSVKIHQELIGDLDPVLSRARKTSRNSIIISVGGAATAGGVVLVVAVDYGIYAAISGLTKFLLITATADEMGFVAVLFGVSAVTVGTPSVMGYKWWREGSENTEISNIKKLLDTGFDRSKAFFDGAHNQINEKFSTSRTSSGWVESIRNGISLGRRDVKMIKKMIAASETHIALLQYEQNYWDNILAGLEDACSWFGRR
ncbi:MAG: hypothetical protein AABZ06_04625 [Bdellovibrionota bacterium]